MFTDEFLGAIANCEVYSGHIELKGQYDWSLIHKLLSRNMLVVNSKDSKRINIMVPFEKEKHIPDAKIVANEMRKTFKGIDIDAQIFANKKQIGETPSHQDPMDVILIQLHGTIEVMGKILKPGDWIVYPRGTYHNVKYEDTRITLSLGIY